MTADRDAPLEVKWEGKYVRTLKRGRWEFVSRTGSVNAVVIVAETEGKVVLIDQYRVPVGKRWLAERHLAPLGGPPPRMPLRLQAWCEAEAQSAIDYLRGRSVDLVGDLEDLRPLPEDFQDGTAIPADELVRVAVGALASIALERLEDQREAGSPPPSRARARGRSTMGLLRRKRP